MTAVSDQPEPSRLAVAPDLRRRHTEVVNAAIVGETDGLEVEAISHSWRRSAQVYRIDTESHEAPHILTESALRLSKEPVEFVVRAAQPELDRLHRIVRQAGYVTLLCDTDGVMVDDRGSEERSAELRHWGIWVGGIWSEAAEGTNGIGTCIADRRAVTVHQTQHFRSRHIGLSCSGAPVFDAGARLVAVLDVSSMDPRLSAQAHALTLPLVLNHARHIEERLFRERFSHAWIVAIAPREDTFGALLAVDREHRVIGADRFSRRQFALDEPALEAGTGLWTIFARTGPIIRHGVGSDYAVRLTGARGGETLFALVSPPAVSRLRPGNLDSTLLMQPRIDLLEDMRRHYAPEVPRGGLSPGALRRVQEYIAAHMHENLDVATLASHVGISRYHFIRAFKTSVGMPPHRYVLEQRVRKAAELLERSDQPLTHIALNLGFADQSHFSRSFHALVGLTPSQFRRAHR
jgi:transcriptional regulator of acetoin/glycerol metabolism/AraC-like DNA-binding protein